MKRAAKVVPKTNVLGVYAATAWAFRPNEQDARRRRAEKKIAGTNRNEVPVEGRKETRSMNNLEHLLQRKADIKSRISILSTELQPTVLKMESLRSRLRDLDDDLRTVLEQIREESKRKENRDSANK